ncbi:MAG: hypothetical protein ACTSSQ_08965, partial [Alphaproteobacteria bacterium]
MSEAPALNRQPSIEGQSRSVRRRVITRALLRDTGAANDPHRQIFHYQHELIDLFAKNRISATFVVPALVLVMGVAVGSISDPFYALSWVVLMLLAHGLVIRGSHRFLAESSSKPDLFLWKRRFVLRDLIYGLSWGIYPLLFPVS